MSNNVCEKQDDPEIFLTPERKWDGPVRPFAPWRITPGGIAPPDTTVQITTSVVADIDLVLSFAPPDGSNTGGTRRVSALQKVSSSVRVDFNQQAALYWIASVQQSNSLSPNQLGYPYAQDTDVFTLQLLPEMNVMHDAGGWKVPSYDSSEMSLNIGFGLNIGDWVYWAYSVPCSPQQPPLIINAGSYELIRGNGTEQLGDPVPVDQSLWEMQLGFSYQLKFDDSGNGILTKLST